MDAKRITLELSDVLNGFFRVRGGDLAKACEDIVRSLRSGGKILIFGNGGSAAEAQHFAAEMITQFRKIKRPGLPAMSLTTDAAVLTAIANDMSFESAFSRQIEALGHPGDVAVALTTSGKSANILEGLKAARAKGMVTIALTGEGGGEISGKSGDQMGEVGQPPNESRQIAEQREGEGKDSRGSGVSSGQGIPVDFLLDVPSRSTPRIQEMHLIILHVMAEEIEKRLGY